MPRTSRNDGHDHGYENGDARTSVVDGHDHAISYRHDRHGNVMVEIELSEFHSHDAKPIRDGQLRFKI